MSNSDSLIAAPPCLYSSAATMGPTATIQTTATPKSPLKASAAQAAEIQQAQSDPVQSRLKKSASRGRSGPKNVRKNMSSFTEIMPNCVINMSYVYYLRAALSNKPASVNQGNRMAVQAWSYNPNSEEDPEEKDPTLPHHFSPDVEVSEEHLKKLGVLAWTSLQTINYKKNQVFEQVKNERGYHYEEVVTVAPGRLANYEQKKKDFFKEHLHEHEEIRLILEGGGYEDIRDFDGHWIRIHITQGVLIVLPKGIYHRFTLDDTNYLKAVLLYQESPSRIQFDRNSGTDIMEVREQYVTNVLSRGSSLQGNSSDFSNMLKGLDEELEFLHNRQLIAEATLDESKLCADDALLAAQFQPQGNNSNCNADVLLRRPTDSRAGSSDSLITTTMAPGPYDCMDVDA